MMLKAGWANIGDVMGNKAARQARCSLFAQHFVAMIRSESQLGFMGPRELPVKRKKQPPRSALSDQIPPESRKTFHAGGSLGMARSAKQQKSFHLGGSFSQVDINPIGSWTSKSPPMSQSPPIPVPGRSPSLNYRRKLRKELPSPGPAFWGLWKNKIRPEEKNVHIVGGAPRSLVGDGSFKEPDDAGH